MNVLTIFMSIGELCQWKQIFNCRKIGGSTIKSTKLHKNGSIFAAIRRTTVCRRSARKIPSFGVIRPEDCALRNFHLQRACFPTRLPVTRSEAFAWHQRPGALARLLPPWENIRVLRPASDINTGTQVEFLTRLGPFAIRWLAEHTACCPPEYFEDQQLRGPFAYWRHRHKFIDDSPQTSVLEDQLEFSLPGGRCGNWLAGRSVAEKIERMFAFRHAVTRADLSAHARYREQPRMSVGITGADGLIGSALTAFLTTGGHRVTAICRSRRETSAPEKIVWNPGIGGELEKAAEKWDAVIHLAGENISHGRWTTKQKREIWSSRVERTRSFCEALVSQPDPPAILLAASGTSFYGDAGSTDYRTENAARGEGFLAELSAAWEEACRPAIDAGIRVVYLRFGMVLSPRGGALSAMLPVFRGGVGGTIGTGKQYWSWISLDDAVEAIHHALMKSEIHGPLNVVAPQPITNADFTQKLARALHRWALLSFPSRVANLCLGEVADALLCSSVAATPEKLCDSGFSFRHAELENAFGHMLGHARAHRK